KLYQMISYSRRMIYEKEIIKRKYLKKPVISIGNLTFGGSGKTPFVIRLGKELIERGIRVSIISRGYKRKSKGLVPVSDGVQIISEVEEAGDEPFMIAKSLPKAVVTVCEDKFLAGKFAEEENEVDIHILDDGFQHYKLFRDFDIVLIKNSKKFMEKKFREPFKVLKRANHIFFIDEINKGVEDFLNKNFIPYSKIDTLNYGFFSSTDRVLDLNWVRENEWIALAGIENPESFFKDLKNFGIKIKETFSYPDHFFPSQKYLQEMEEKIKNLKVRGIITTQKDVYKWKGNFEVIYHKIGFPPLEKKFLDRIVKIYEKKVKKLN
ncbi:MAG: tetraacyldisaccharide 4'-kinase, partial [Thermoanaerobaculia bacterium]